MNEPARPLGRYHVDRYSLESKFKHKRRIENV